MRTRAKALTVAVAMVTTFVILPTFGAAAAEPLADGSYDVPVGESSYTVEVVEGAPVVGEVEGVAFLFAFDEETGRVLDEFDVSVDGATYDVTVAEDGTVTVTRAVTDGESEDDGSQDGEETGEGGESTEGDEPSEDELDGDADKEPAADETEDEDELEGLEEQDGEETEAEDAAHGQLVSTVAQCAPRGREAREAGLPNHGFFVRAAAHGEDVEFDLDGETLTAALSSQEGADAFCALAEGLLDTAEAPSGEAGADTEDDEVDTAETEDDEQDEANGRRGKGGDGASDRGKGRANAPGQQKKNG